MAGATKAAKPAPTTAAPPGTPVPRGRTGTPEPIARGNTAATGGASMRTERAAGITGRAWRASGSGRPATGRVSVRGVIWLFVWIGVLLYLVSNPLTLPRFVHLVFAPVNGLLAVARGAHVASAKIA